MSAVAIAWSALSALGPRAGSLAASRGEPARVAISLDAELSAAGLQRPSAGRVAEEHLGAPGAGDRAARLLGTASRDLALDLDRVRPGWRDLRVGLVLGTSSGGMPSFQDLFVVRQRGEVVSPELARRATYFAPMQVAIAEMGLATERVVPRLQILAACAASTFAIGVATRWLARGAADLVIAGGYDALALLVAAGFEALRATTPGAPRPFQLGRDGMSLGEGAGLVALVRADAERSSPRRFAVLGFGASTDAVHVTAPDRSGDGLARAIGAALRDAAREPEDVAFVSAHATATPFNDSMEARAFASTFGASVPPTQPLKAQIGHTLGAAGAVETIAAAASLEIGLAPPAAISGPLDPDCAVRLLERAAPIAEVSPGAVARGRPCVLKVSAAFGGSNAALVIDDGQAEAPPPRPAPRRVFLSSRARVTGADEARAWLDRAGVTMDRTAKLDSLSLLACGAVARLVAEGAKVEGAGVVAGHALGTVDIDERFFARILARGGAAGEPRLFPATSPNVCAGHAAILFRLTGPSAATCGGLDGGTEALALAAELIAAGDVDRVVVLAVDEIGAASREILGAGFPAASVPSSGAVAALLTVHPHGALAEVPLDLAPDHDGSAIGHEALDARLDALRGPPVALGGSDR